MSCQSDCGSDVTPTLDDLDLIARKRVGESDAAVIFWAKRTITSLRERVAELERAVGEFKRGIELRDLELAEFRRQADDRSGCLERAEEEAQTFREGIHGEWETTEWWMEKATKAEARCKELEGYEFCEACEAYSKTDHPDFDCPRCGAPQCCPTCCKIETLRERAERAEKRGEAVNLALTGKADQLAEAEALNTRYREALEKILRFKDGCGCDRICHCNDNVDALLAWKDAVSDTAAAALEDSEGRR